MIEEEYTPHPFYGTRRMVVIVSNSVGYRVNRKHVQRLTRQWGLQGMALALGTPSIRTCYMTLESPAPTKSGEQSGYLTRHWLS